MKKEAIKPEGVNPLTIHASPTKEFFITMLVKDLTLRDAIGDLVDNSVDGAKVLKPDNNYEGLEVEIEAYADHFGINDNCSGIEAETARTYAFRFGRPRNQPISRGSVGQFGIGMKRSLFKLGNEFSIDSIAATSSFKVDLNVEEWAQQTEWDFTFTEVHENESNVVDKRGTKIKVLNLNHDVREQFQDPNFIKKLIKEIELEHLYNIHKGLKIKINDVTLKSRQLNLFESDSFQTAKYTNEDDGLKVELFAGVGEQNLEDGGWYIFCNNRLIVGPEQTELSGWTGQKGDGGPNYHHQFSRFRGYAFLSAEDPSLLPWNTTKNGMDRDSPKFKQIRLQMISMMSPVITFLNQVKKEREGDSSSEDRPLEQLLINSTKTNLSNLKSTSLANRFTFPQIAPVKKQAPNESKIIFTVPTKKLNEVKKHTGISSAKDVGKKVFSYYYEMEIEG